MEIVHDGCLYHNELDARWDVFFHTFGITTEYQLCVNGKDHSSQFWIDAWKSMVLIKPLRPTEQEIDTAKDIATDSTRNVVLIWGEPFARLDNADRDEWIIPYRFMIIPPGCYRSTDPRPKLKEYASREASLEAFFNGESQYVDDPSIPYKNDIYMTCCIFAICRRCPAVSYIDVEHSTLTHPISSANSEGSGTFGCEEGCTGAVDREPLYDDYRLVAAYTAVRITQFDESQ